MNSNQSTSAISSEARERELSGCWDSLIDVLGRQIAIYGELAEVCCREREILVSKFSAHNLLDSNSRKETIILKAKMIDEARMKIVARIAELIGIPVQGIDLTTLIGHAGSEKGAVMRDLQGRLRSLLEELNENNDENRELLNSSILYVQKSIEFISRLMTSSAAYGTDGALKVSGASGRIVCRKE